MHACLKNECTVDKKCHNLMRWLICVFCVQSKDWELELHFSHICSDCSGNNFFLSLLLFQVGQLAVICLQKLHLLLAKSLGLSLLTKGMNRLSGCAPYDLNNAVS